MIACLLEPWHTFKRLSKVRPSVQDELGPPFIIVNTHLLFAVRARVGRGCNSPCLCAEQPSAELSDDAERKVALVLSHGLRAHRRAAEAFVASPTLQRYALADYQQRIETLRLYSRPLASVPFEWFRRGLTSNILPRLVYVSAHAYALRSVARA